MTEFIHWSGEKRKKKKKKKIKKKKEKEEKKKINKEKCTISRVQIEERKFEGEKNHERESRELIRPIKEKQCAFYTAKTPT